MCDTRIVDLTRRCKPLVFVFYICCFVLVNKYIIYLWCNISWQVSNRPLSAEFGHVTQAKFCGPEAVGVHRLCPCQIWSRYFYSFQSYKGVPKFWNLVTWPRPRPLWGRLWCGRSRGPSSMSVPNLKPISIRSKVIRGSQNFEIWSRDPARPRQFWGRFMIQTQ